ncbi:unnamed protein product [Linum tenue]|uniref:Uncharacterized protein n=1 Tax=Linum tenue TaxID=586396 RepID=A0AAV0MGI2_9ROSI|nr:unnamed protein product [Linum tenue]
MAEGWLGPSVAKGASSLLFHTPNVPAPFSSSSASSSRSALRQPRSVSMAASASQTQSSPNSSSEISSPRPTQPSLLVFSGGTAFNGVVEELKKLTTRVTHVLPVSDDGGSTAEIVRVLGGPAVGDIRSRCLRLSDQSTVEALSVRSLLGHRLPLDAHEAKSECFFVHEMGLIRGLNSGNFRLCEGPMKHFASVMADIPSESLVLPVISTNDRLTLGCELWNGTIIRGQNEISHPTNGSMQPIDKGCCSALPSRIKRVFYMSSEGGNSLHEVFPTVNATVLDQLSTVDCIVYAMGSLFTSVCPSLVLRGVGENIASRTCPKVLMLNGTHDRETIGFSASSFVTAMADALNRRYGDPHNCLGYSESQYVNTLLVPKGGAIPIDLHSLNAQGIFDVIVVDSVEDPKVGIIFDPASLINALADLIGRHMSSIVKV